MSNPALLVLAHRSMFCLRSVMRFDRDQLTFKALCALDQIANECSATPTKRTYAIRFVLAYLYTVGEGDRRPFDEFWRIIAEPLEWSHSNSQAKYFRSTHARTALFGIARSVGYPMTPEAWQRLALWRKPGQPIPPDGTG